MWCGCLCAHAVLTGSRQKTCRTTWTIQQAKRTMAVKVYSSADQSVQSAIRVRSVATVRLGQDGGPSTPGLRPSSDFSLVTSWYARFFKQGLCMCNTMVSLLSILQMVAVGVVFEVGGSKFLRTHIGRLRILSQLRTEPQMTVRKAVRAAMPTTQTEHFETMFILHRYVDCAQR